MSANRKVTKKNHYTSYVYKVQLVGRFGGCFGRSKRRGGVEVGLDGDGLREVSGVGMTRGAGLQCGGSIVQVVQGGIGLALARTLTVIFNVSFGKPLLGKRMILCLL